MGSSQVINIDDVPVDEVWKRLQSDPAAKLIDVRTEAEWAYVGVPDLARIGKEVLLVQWQTYPDNRVDPRFAEQLSALLAKAGVTKDSELFFICRSGGRSRSAALTMAAGGYSRCRNVADGFEGPLDASRHRGRVAGWKVAGLPWAQG